LVRCHMSYQFIDSLNSVRTEKISEQIASQLRSAIFSGLLKQGDRLPSERELGERFNASRNSVREAVRILELSGLLRVKRGSGVFVSDDNARPIRDSLNTMLKMRTVTLTELTEARIVTEPGLANLACKNATAEDLARLEENIAEARTALSGGSSAFAENIVFHRLVAQATHNGVIVATMDTFFDMLKEASLEIIGRSTDAFAGSPNAIRFHDEILAAFQRRDSGLAQGLMLDHVLQIQTALRLSLGREKCEDEPGA
jgi:GntR family transcriptional repressor for pyruvate dehydrogenase complex